MNQHPVIYIVSDSLGETAQTLAKASICQFPNQEEWEIRRIPYITSRSQMAEVLLEVKNQGAMMIFSLVNEELAAYARDYCVARGIHAIDLMTHLLQQMACYTGQKPLREAGRIRQLNKSYFDRIEAIEFAVKYDDGKDPRGLLKADVVLLGVSRTSKTPLSIYLSNRQIKVANLPLVPESPLPKELYQVDTRRIIGLTNSPQTLNRIRSERLKAMGLHTSTDYTKLDAIIAELNYANQVMASLNCPVIDVEQRSIEETAGMIIDILTDNGLVLNHLGVL
ncbi:kinase/pyrophosphorylase [Streptococcus gallolyticus]|uniref:pyruvate, water dikinase regulatory protein n=1 Tax=Streptococcus hepaticus TaxID=3349163 RepID=UPI001C94F67B|nr:kinase/pyrophosphorylase [Streptococcus gallolyticus]MBY5041731.1 kinase/pyrophosphorylase [Streptococcus gallolyticus]